MKRPEMDELRAKLNALILDETMELGKALNGLSHVEIAEVLVGMAVSFCDFNGGKDDELHARKVCHRLVDKAERPEPVEV
jgi:hypothetical protein